MGEKKRDKPNATQHNSGMRCGKIFGTKRLSLGVKMGWKGRRYRDDDWYHERWRMMMEKPGSRDQPRGWLIIKLFRPWTEEVGWK